MPPRLDVCLGQFLHHKTWYLVFFSIQNQIGSSSGVVPTKSEASCNFRGNGVELQRDKPAVAEEETSFYFSWIGGRSWFLILSLLFFFSVNKGVFRPTKN
ncbi:hypothetical protein S83_026864 [Arachis hypogaea]|nr:uncharacterized protein DS421_8g248980 [Arachis hypogaea]